MSSSQLFSCLIEKAKLSLKAIHYYEYNYRALSQIKNMTGLRVLKLQSSKLNPDQMAIIESLPNLVELTGLNPAIQTDNTFLDKLFNSCGKTLESLEFQISSQRMPRALFWKNPILKHLVIYNHTPRPVGVTEVKKICNSKSPGFSLNINNSEALTSVDDYVKIVRHCPKSVIKMGLTI